MNLPTLLVLAVVAALLALAIVYMVRQRKKGGCACLRGDKHSRLLRQVLLLNFLVLISHPLFPAEVYPSFFIGKG